MGRRGLPQKLNPPPHPIIVVPTGTGRLPFSQLPVGLFSIIWCFKFVCLTPPPFITIIFHSVSSDARTTLPVCLSFQNILEVYIEGDKMWAEFHSKKGLVNTNSL